MTNYVIGPDGAPITRADLPSPSGRWTIKRKAIVLAAIRGGLLSLEEATKLYRFTPSEVERISELVNQYGEQGLRQTRIAQYRSGL